MLNCFREGKYSEERERRVAGVNVYRSESNTHEGTPVWVVDAVLHCLVDELWVGWGSSEGGGENSQPLQVEHLEVSDAVEAGGSGLLRGASPILVAPFRRHHTSRAVQET